MFVFTVLQSYETKECPKVSAKSFRPSAVGRENCRFFAFFPTILSRLMFFNYVHTASLKSAMLLYWWRQYDYQWICSIGIVFLLFFKQFYQTEAANIVSVLMALLLGSSKLPYMGTQINNNKIDFHRLRFFRYKT